MFSTTKDQRITLRRGEGTETQSHTHTHKSNPSVATHYREASEK